jgi:stage V sporulation protein B
LDTTDVAKGTFHMTSTQIIQYTIFALFYMILAKSNALTPEDLGVLSILTFIASALTLSQLNLPIAITKFMSEYLGMGESEKAASVQRTVERLIIILSLLGFIIPTFFSAQLSQYFWGTTENSVLIILISLEALFLNLFVFYQSGLRALNLFDKIALTTIIYVVSGRIVAVLLALQNFGVVGVLIGYVIGAFLGLLAVIAFSRNKLSIPAKKTPIKPIIHFSFPLFLGSLADFISNQVDILIIASFTFNYRMLGIYSIVVKSLSVLYIIWQPIIYTIFPLISAKFGLQDPVGINKVVKMSSRYLAYTIIPSCVMLGAIAPAALEVFYGPNYISGATALTVLAISITIFAFFKLFTTALTAIGETKEVLKINLILALAAVVLLVCFVPIFNVVGAATARLLAYTLALILATYIMRKYLGNLQIDKEAIWKSTIASVATLPFLIVLDYAITNGLPIVQLFILKILIAGLVYLLALRSLNAVNKQDFELLNQFFPKSFSKIINFLQKVIARQ